MDASPIRVGGGIVVSLPRGWRREKSTAKTVGEAEERERERELDFGPRSLSLSLLRARARDGKKNAIF